MDLTSLSPQTLRKAADLQARILELQNQLGELLGGGVAPPAGATAEPLVPPTSGRKKRRKLSAKGLANIRAGAAKRWGKKGKAAQPVGVANKPKRKMSAAAKARLSALAKARWKKAKSAGKSRL
jgi:hypothetical protein